MTLVLLLTSVAVIFIIFTIYLRSSVRICTSKVAMEGKVVIVTGANVGIGFFTARNLALRGARVILACRDEARGVAARDEIVAQTGNQDVVFRQLDLASLKSVRSFAATILNTETQLHVLVNNAGVYGFYDYTADGIIETMQVNYFGPFLLTLLLLPLLKKSQPSRVINLSSILHFLGDFDPKTINKKTYFDAVIKYSNSKFCMLTFSVELTRRLEGTGVVVNAVHPGVIMTNLVLHRMNAVLYCFFWCWSRMYSRTADQGAQTVVHLAVDEECANVSGKYFVDCESRFMSMKARNKRVAKELWEYSEKLVGYEAS